MFSLLMQWMRRNKILPKISDTERQALEAGDVWVEGDIFAGRADFERLLAQSYHQLPADEQAFLDGPCDELMRMVSDYELSRTRRLPPLGSMSRHGCGRESPSRPCVRQRTDPGAACG